MDNTAKNFWKRYAEWATELKDDPFVSARIKLTILYAISLLAVFLITPLVFSAAPRDGILATYQEAGTLYTIVALLLIAITFFIGGTTMTPIRRILRAQKRFIADASHELRTPLAIMKTNSEVALIDEAHLDPAEAAEALRSNLEEIDRMSKIIENLLSLSFYDNRVAEIPFMPINLSELIAHITEKAKSLAVRKSITLRLLNTDPGMIFGNPVAIEQMAINLIKNAVTYTERGGTVSVSVTLKENNAQLEFKVKDTGIGIQEKDLPHVFSAFYKAGHSRTQHEMESSGLGLTIVKKIVERHHGMIYINSKIGKGTTVSVTFPRITPGSS